VYQELSERLMNKARPYIEELEENGVYLSTTNGERNFIPWQNITHFTLNTHEKRYNALIKFKEGNEVMVRITEPYSIAQRIYKVLFNHGDNGMESLPEFEIT
jgi:hypothetical protein